MSDHTYISLIQGLNSDDSSINSPTDHTDELSLWTNAEFTFDIPPSFTVFDSTDNAFNHIEPLTRNDPILGQQQQPFIDYLNLVQQQQQEQQEQ